MGLSKEAAHYKDRSKGTEDQVYFSIAVHFKLRCQGLSFVLKHLVLADSTWMNFHATPEQKEEIFFIFV